MNLWMRETNGEDLRSLAIASKDGDDRMSRIDVSPATGYVARVGSLRVRLGVLQVFSKQAGRAGFAKGH